MGHVNTSEDPLITFLFLLLFFQWCSVLEMPWPVRTSWTLLGTQVLAVQNVSGFSLWEAEKRGPFWMKKQGYCCLNCRAWPKNYSNVDRDLFFMVPTQECFGNGRKQQEGISLSFLSVIFWGLFGLGFFLLFGGWVGLFYNGNLQLRCWGLSIRPVSSNAFKKWGKPDG